MCFLPCWSFVSFGIWRNIWGRARDWNKSSQKGRTGKKKKRVTEYIRTHVMCIELCFTSWQKPSYHWKSKRKRMSYWKSRVYMANPCQTRCLFCVWQNQRSNIVESINYVTFLNNRFLRLISLPTSTIFVSGTSESVSYFLEFFCITAILKI